MMWERPQLLWLAILLPLLGAAAASWLWSEWKRYWQECGRGFGRVRRRILPWRTRFGLLLLIAVLAASGLVVAGPEKPGSEYFYPRARNAIAIVVDTSLSMLADADPKKPGISRLDAAKAAIKNAVTEFNGDSVLLITFTNEPVIWGQGVSKFSTDYARYFFPYLHDVDYYYVSELANSGKGGTNIPLALLTAYEQLVKHAPSADVGKFIILLTDGERSDNIPPSSKEPQQFFKDAKGSEHLAMYFVPVGDPDTEMTIPLLDQNGNRADVWTYKKGKYAGQKILTRPDYDYLRQIAEQVSAKFIPGRSGNELARAVKSALRNARFTVGKRESRAAMIHYGDRLAKFAFAGSIILFFLL